MKQFLALAVLPLLTAPAMAAPYVESKSTGAIVDGDYTGAQTELRIGYEQKLDSGITLFAEIGPGYEWNNVGIGNEAVAVGEVGANFPVGESVSIKAKFTGEHGFDSEIFALGGELKVRYTF